MWLPLFFAGGCLGWFRTERPSVSWTKVSKTPWSNPPVWLYGSTCAKASASRGRYRICLLTYWYGPPHVYQILRLITSPLCSLGQPPPWQNPSRDSSHLLEAIHPLTHSHWSYWISTSLFSLRSRHGWSNDPRDQLTLRRICRRHFSSLKSDQSPLFEVSWYPSLTLSCDLSSQDLLGWVLSAHEVFFATFGNPSCAIDFHDFGHYYDALESLAGLLTFQHPTSTSRQSHPSFPSSLTVLHYIVKTMKQINQTNSKTN